MQAEFSEAAFALQPGEMSGIVDTASGLHLIERYVWIPRGFWVLAISLGAIVTDSGVSQNRLKAVTCVGYKRKYRKIQGR